MLRLLRLVIAQTKILVQVQKAMFLLLNQEVDELSAQVRLRWKFRAGQQMQLKISQKATTKTSVNNRPLAITSALEMDVDWTVGKLASRGCSTLCVAGGRAPSARPRCPQCCRVTCSWARLRTRAARRFGPPCGWILRTCKLGPPAPSARFWRCLRVAER